MIRKHKRLKRILLIGESSVIVESKICDSSSAIHQKNKSAMKLFYSNGMFRRLIARTGWIKRKLLFVSELRKCIVKFFIFPLLIKCEKMYIFFS